MEIFERIYIDGVYVIDVKITRPTIDNAVEFRKLIENEIQSGHTKLVVDLRRCEYVDSTFFGALVVAARKLSDIGYKLKIVRSGIVGNYLFILSDSSQILEKYNTREEAIKSFDGDD